MGPPRPPGAKVGAIPLAMIHTSRSVGPLLSLVRALINERLAPSCLPVFSAQFHLDAFMWSGRKTGAQDRRLVDVIVLYIDDKVRESIAKFFKTLPVRTFIANSGSHANKILDDVPCRLIVTDRLLPPWPELGRFGRLRIRKPNLRIAFVDNGIPDGRALAHAVGATDFLPRPVTRQSLVNVFKRVETPPQTVARSE